jgi:hypothetical protein
MNLMRTASMMLVVTAVASANPVSGITTPIFELSPNLAPRGSVQSTPISGAQSSIDYAVASPSRYTTTDTNSDEDVFLPSWINAAHSNAPLSDDPRERSIQLSLRNLRRKLHRQRMSPSTPHQDKALLQRAIRILETTILETPEDNIFYLVPK